jgi:hypothetical protein
MLSSDFQLLASEIYLRPSLLLNLRQVKNLWNKILMQVSFRGMSSVQRLNRQITICISASEVEDGRDTEYSGTSHLYRIHSNVNM